MPELFLLFLAACLVNNLVADYLLGVGLALAGAEKIRVAMNMALALTCATSVVAAVVWLADTWLISPLQLENYRLILLTPVIAGVCLGAGKIPGRAGSRLSEALGRFHPLFIMNCALLGAVLISLQRQSDLAASVFFGVSAGIGFSLVLLCFTAIDRRLAVTDLPAPFRGLPIQMISLGIISLAFSGLTGLADA